MSELPDRASGNGNRAEETREVGGLPREFIVYLEALRGLAIVLVILTHTTSGVRLLSLFQNGTLFFLFLSGFFLAHLDNSGESCRDFWRRKFHRLAWPYLCAVVPGVVAMWWLNPSVVTPRWLVTTVLTGVGHFNDPHWFIPCLGLLFLLLPVWRWLRRSSPRLVVATLIWLALGALTFRSSANHNPVLNLLHLGGVFLAGICYCEHRARLEALGARWFWPLVIGSFAVFLITLPRVPNSLELSFERVLGERLITLNDAFLGKIVLIPGLLVILKRLTDSGWSLTSLRFLARLSYGLFFWHMYVIWLLYFGVQVVWPDEATLSWVERGLICWAEFTGVLLLLCPTLVLLRRWLGRRGIWLTGT